MGGTCDSHETSASGGGKARGPDDAAKAAFVEGLRRGLPRKDAAAAAGWSIHAFYRARKKDALFRAGWRAAHDASAAAEARGNAAARRRAGREVRIAPNNQRALQLRPIRSVRFDEQRQQDFLASFSLSCDMLAAAAEAGVSERTVCLRLRTDPAFAAGYFEALELGYVRLEAEALRQRVAAQARLRGAIEGAEQSGVAPDGEPGAEFERVMKLLARRDRKPRRPDRETNGARRVWTAEAAIATIERRLAALGVAVAPLPAAVAERYDGGGDLEGGPVPGETGAGTGGA